MALARRFHSASDTLLTAAGGFGKLVELIALDDDEIEALGRGEEVRGLSLCSLARMTVRQVREALRAGQDVPFEKRAVLQSAGKPLTRSPLRGERQADYCRSLGKVITRYLTPSELQAYGEHLEAFAAQVEQAQAEGHRAKLMFGYAVKAEAVHAQLYARALAAVEAGADLSETNFYLCPVCGHIEFGAPPEKCPICGAAASRFVEAA